MRTEPAAARECQYPLLVSLSAQQALPSLHDALLDAVAAACPGVPVGLYLREPRQGGWREVVALGGEDADESPAGLAAVLQDLAGDTPDEMFSEQRGCTALPVRSGRRLLGAVALAGDRRGVLDAFLRSLLQVYGNQLALLHRSRTDALTGLLNRQSFEEAMARLFGDAAWARRRQHDLRGRWCVAVLDIDHFKRINDNFGHLYGDEVLLLLAQLMMDSFRDEDLLFRYGGEEFVVLLADVDQQGAWRVLDRFRQALQRRVFPQVGRVTVSIGFSVPQQPLPVSTVLAHADRALYYAKEHGRNQVAGYERLLAAGRLGADAQAGSEVELF